MQVPSQTPHPLMYLRLPYLNMRKSSPLHGSGFHIHHQLVWSICIHMLTMARRQMCYIFCALIFANAVYNAGYSSLPNCVLSGGSSLEYHTWDVSCRLKPEPPLPNQSWLGAYGGTEDCSVKGWPPGDSGSSTDTLQMILQTLRIVTGDRGYKKEQASVHPLIYICSTWKGTVCYVDKDR